MDYKTLKQFTPFFCTFHVLPVIVVYGDIDNLLEAHICPQNTSVIVNYGIIATRNAIKWRIWVEPERLSTCRSIKRKYGPDW